MIFRGDFNKLEIHKQLKLNILLHLILIIFSSSLMAQEPPAWQVWEQKADKLFEQKDYVAAQQAFEQALDANPPIENQHELQSFLSYSLFHQKKYTQARDVLLQLTRTDTDDNTGAWDLLIMTYQALSDDLGVKRAYEGREQIMKKRRDFSGRHDVYHHLKFQADD